MCVCVYVGMGVWVRVCVWVGNSGAITPAHFDEMHNFFVQVVWVYVCMGVWVHGVCVYVGMGVWVRACVCGLAIAAPSPLHTLTKCTIFSCRCYGCMGVWVYGCMGASVYVGMGVWVHVCVCGSVIVAPSPLHTLTKCIIFSCRCCGYGCMGVWVCGRMGTCVCMCVCVYVGMGVWVHACVWGRQ